ncbi:MAG: molybdopterin-dependent oxidoreductase [Nocardioidaceae bacterium]|nr:molybdopterin-dependent oxidoreductase [Nocardioidaceae bacterium]
MTTTATTKLTAAGLGLLAAASGVAASSGVAALTGTPSPIISVGNRFILLTPGWLKDFAIEQFGTNDKPVLIGGVVAAIAILAAVAGLLALSRPRVAVGITAALGLVALLAAVTDGTTDANIVQKALPGLVALVVSVGALVLLFSEYRRRTDEKTHVLLDAHPGDDLPAGFDRRRFLTVVLGTGAVLVLGGAVGRFLGGGAASASRSSITIPRPAVPAPAVPAGVQADVTGISRYLTRNRDFYRIDTALQVPDVPADTWSIRIHGMVDNELNLSFADVLDRRLVESRITLTCVSNQVGGPYVGNASWIGVPLQELLAEAGVQDGADAVKSTSADDMTIGTPLEAMTDDRGSLLAIAMNGEPLPLEHGFPARLVVPGLFGYVSATKWVVDLEVTRFQDFEAYWTPRGYSEKAPIKFSSRIDVPKAFQTFPRDAVRVGGVAWAQTVGIQTVEVQVDDSDWSEVTLATQDNVNTWRQWSWEWQDATPGNHTLRVRATNGDGETQTSDRASVRPDGSTGWHSIQFRVED